MKKILLLLIVVNILCICSLHSIFKEETTNRILGTWIVQEPIGGANENNSSTPKTIQSTKKLLFTQDGNVISYQNDIALKISKYKIHKGISVLDNLEHDLVTFEKSTYVIEQLDNKSLTITNNLIKGHRSSYKK